MTIATIDDDGPARVLLVLPRSLLDRARTLAGKSTATLKLPVSLQVVLRSLIEEGLRRRDDPAVLASIEAGAMAVHHRRRVVRRTDGSGRRGVRRARG